MIAKPAILQGTDGIRARITSDQKLAHNDPIEFFLDSKYLTPAFFERYTYAFGKLLINSGLAAEKESIIIGWDPRDKEGKFNQAAIRGIRKSGLNAIVVGTLPTPAIPLYMQYIDAAGSVVLTASHNPADQNGIKLFCGYTALKLLPPDDCQLTTLVYDQQSLDIKSLEETGGLEYQEKEAKDFFVQYCLDSRNSWINQEHFEDIMLVVDASNGAVAEVAREVFAKLPFNEVVFTNMEGNINERSGVADIEGLETITRESVTLPGAQFSSYQTLVTLFEKSEVLKNAQTSHLKLVGFVFDGDGDRCYRLDYLPDSDCLHVSSGDLLGIHQAKFIKKELIDNDSLFINTVESDLNTAITARELGFTPVLTGVGDKWILVRAVVDLISSQLPDDQQIKQQFTDLVSKKSGMSAIEISAFWKKVTQNKLTQTSSITKFRIGIEESGHCITPGYMEKKGNLLTTFSGNGIKTALNSLQSLLETVDPDQWYQTIKQPFTAGVGKTFYTYYVDKARLSQKNAFRAYLQTSIQDQFHQFFEHEFELEIVEFIEEKEMLYCSILKNHTQCAAIFIRNSGTEDKSALYLRGTIHLSASLEKMGNMLHLLMLQGLKDRSNEFAKFEVDILKELLQQKPLQNTIRAFPELPHDRIFKEMELKEGLVVTEAGNLTITGKGKQFIESWE